MSEDSPQHRIIVAGFGGQGVLTLGKLLCLASMKEGKQVTYMPAYGSEVRGGTANCHLVIGDGPIFSPLVEQADSLIILNQLSYRRFAKRLRPSGHLVINSSLVDPADDGDPGDNGAPSDCTVISVPATGRAAALGNVIFTNVIMLGAYVKATGICRDENILTALEESLRGKRDDLLEPNREAYRTGGEMVEEADL